jgi:hypothetical protein
LFVEERGQIRPANADERAKAAETAPVAKSVAEEVAA